MHTVKSLFSPLQKATLWSGGKNTLFSLCPSGCSFGLFVSPSHWLDFNADVVSGTSACSSTEGRASWSDSSQISSPAQSKARTSAKGIPNALTVDVEDYFQVSAFEETVSPADWDSMPHRVEANTMRILELFARYGVKGTFFTLGWVAKRYPGVVKAIAAEGHEVASHGYSHSRINTLSQSEFRNEILRSKSILEDLSGLPVTGFRAPSWTIAASTLWALDVLIECGFSYDSSIFPIYHDIYGMPDANRFLHHMQRESGSIIEFPPTTVRCSVGRRSLNIPAAGGGYMRLFPGSVLRRAVRYVNEKEEQPAVLYFHPWEIDPEQPRLQAGWKSRFRHYLNLHRMEDRLKAMLEQFAFAPMKDVIALWEKRELEPQMCHDGVTGTVLSDC